MIKKLKKFLILSLISYSGLMTYFAINQLNPISVGEKILGRSGQDHIRNIEDEFSFIQELLNAYYTINPEDSQQKKHMLVATLVSNDIDSDFIKEYKNTVNLYTSKKASRSFNLKKVLRDKEKTSSYKVFLDMTSKFPNEKEKRFLMEIDLIIKADPIQPNKYSLSSWQEKVLTRPPELLTSTKVLVDKTAFTELRLPCNFQYVGPTKNHENIAVNLESRNKVIKLKTKEALTSPAEYTASCKNHIFHLDLETDDKNQTIFHAFNMSDGTKKFRKLSEREKLIRTLESHMDVKVQR